jgi:hypothetical protein
MNLSKINNLKFFFPELSRQWHPTKNGNLTPGKVTPGSNKKVWWRCEKGHEWQAAINARSRARGTGCPYCAGQRAGHDNNLRVLNPELSKQWHPTKNGNLKPEHVVPGTTKKAWWKCKKGHEWEARIRARDKGNGCPYCSGRIASASYNLEIVNPGLCKEWHPDKNENLTPDKVTPGSRKKAWWRCEKGHEWKEYIYNRNKGIGCPYCSGRRASRDYNLQVINPGLAKEWHPGKNGSLKPDQVTPGSTKEVWWRCAKGHEWKKGIVDRKKVGCPYCSCRRVGSDNNLLIVYPHLAKQWHPTKNGELKPEQVSYKKVIKVWWLCEKGHEWQATISSRGSNSLGCPDCSKKRASKYHNLQIDNPTLAKEWHPDKNGDLTPDKVTPFSSKKAWWICKYGHEWQAQISNRNHGIGCPFCSGRKVTKESNLKVVNPGLARQWHPYKNGELTPDKVKPNSGKKVWWRCKRGHDWQATVSARQKGVGCRICSYLDKKPRDLLIYESPGLAGEWHPTANGDLTPADITAGSGRCVWWMCKKGHEWKVRVGTRVRYKTGCPYCGNRKACKDNCLSTVYPELAKQWHPMKNGSLKPNQVTKKSRKMIWWKCEKGHSWKAKIQQRANHNGCPYCSGRLATKEYNLEIFNPGLAKQWHPTKNGNLTPGKVTPQSGLKVWWRCKNGHEWQSIVRKKNNKCPSCNNSKE